MMADGNHCPYGEIVCDGVSRGFTTDAFCYWDERAQRNTWGVQQRFIAGCPGRRLAPEPFQFKCPDNYEDVEFNG